MTSQKNTPTDSKTNSKSKSKKQSRDTKRRINDSLDEERVPVGFDLYEIQVVLRDLKRISSKGHCELCKAAYLDLIDILMVELPEVVKYQLLDALHGKLGKGKRKCGKSS
jgi:hypothetical protein